MSEKEVMINETDDETEAKASEKKYETNKIEADNSKRKSSPSIE